MAESLIGQDFTPPDIRAKVTGRAKYAEDFRADGMVFCRFLTSPMPHARVRSIDASEALAMDGVLAVLTADDLPAMAGLQLPILTNEPSYVGEPILAVAAVDETTAEDALERIRVDLEPLPFTLDPLESLREGGPNAREGGNVPNSVQREGQSEEVEGDLLDVKWPEEVFLAAAEGELPMGEAPTDWSYGDVDAGFANADLVVDESFVTAGYSHNSMETRSAMAYWENGKCYVYGSTQSSAFAVPGLAQYIGVSPDNLVFISEFCGGGFGSKAAHYPIMALPAHMAKKTGRPVMMRISRAEENFIGSARPAFQGRIRMGFRADGLLLAVDLFVVQMSGPYGGGDDYLSAAEAVSIVYSPAAMRFRGISVLTNSPPRGPQRGPGQNQIACAVEPVFDKAARELGLDRVEIRKVNAANNDTRWGPNQVSLTSAYLRDALEIGAERFGWEERKARSGQRQGSTIIGIGVGQAYHQAGYQGFDGLVRITPDGVLHIHSPCGNLGTFSFAASARVAAEVLAYDWEHCVVEHGNSRQGVPFNYGQFGSNTMFTTTRTNHVAATDALRKLRELAALELGGSPEDYEIGDETVFARANPARRLTYARAARLAAERGGAFSGEETPDNLNPLTRLAVASIAGTGLIGVGAVTQGLTGTVPALAAGFVEVELDVDTGKVDIVDYLGVADCGKVVHPQGLAAQIRSGAIMGFGMANLERHIYDPHYGIAAVRGFMEARLPTYLDVPPEMQWAAVDKADPENPIGAKGIGEPLQGCAAAALLCAISDALGGHVFNRVPVTSDMIVNVASARPQSYRPLAVNNQ